LFTVTADVTVTSAPPSAAAVMATRDAAAAASAAGGGGGGGGDGDDYRAFVLYMRPSYRRAMIDVVRAYRWTRIYYIYTEPEGTAGNLKSYHVNSNSPIYTAPRHTRQDSPVCVVSGVPA